jgi:predicted RNase H-like HicB family nuclease
MAEVAVYIEVGPHGEGMAHVPALPGCMTRGPDVAAALAVLPAAIHAYYAWLRRHGEDAPDPPSPLTLTVRETRAGGGPFAHGDPAALFTPDKAPLSRDEMEAYFRRAGYSRMDLLELVRGVPAALRDWRAGPGAMSIREILRHIGNAEEWYVSRLVDPAALPPAWEHDEALSLTRFLAMEAAYGAGPPAPPD